MPGETPAISATLLQQKLQHANALKQQMMRVQMEQGASDGFAQKAFEAQQAYLAEMAYEHHQGYLELAQKQGGIQAVKQFGQPVPTSNSAMSSQSSAFPQTYSPPVHAAPQGVSLSLGDEPGKASPAIQLPTQNRYAVYQQPDRPHQDSQTYRAPQQKPSQPLYQYVEVAPAAAAPVFQQASTPRQQNTNRPPARKPEAAASRTATYPASANRAPQVTLAQSATVERSRSQSAPVFPMMPKQKVHGPNDPYVLGEEPPVGLQDRIESLLAKPHFQSVSRGSSGSPQRRSRSMASRPTVATQAKPVQAAVHYQGPRGTQRLATRSRATAATRRSDAELRHAFEMEHRMQNAMKSRVEDVRQVAMTAPVQDPFNDQSSSSPISRFPSAQKYGSSTPAKQVSILTNRQELADTTENQFGGGQLNQTPIEDSTTRGSQDKTDDELKKIDEELARRMKEFENQEMQDDEEKARLQKIADELDKESAAPSDGGIGRSIVDQEMPEQEFRTKPIEKSCAEFRNELLNSSIRDISLDISPPASSVRDQYVAISRSWTDRNGQVVATGSMVDLRRGYVIIDGASGMLKIPYAKLSDADWAAISDYWRLPELCSVGNQGSATRNWVPQTFTWHASSLCHKPLFFENIQLERYGHTHGPFSQPVHSVAHFFVSLVSVPYQSAMTPANECQYALGFYRPGNCAPWLKDPIPFSLDGTRRQALITTGAAFIP